MLAAYMIGLLPDGEAVYTDSNLPIEEQKKAALEWPRHHELLSVHAIVGGTITDITAAFCKMWINRADLSWIEGESDFPEIIRDTVPELVSEVISAWEDEANHQRHLRADYHASVL